jgi:hypothetical protein
MLWSKAGGGQEDGAVNTPYTRRLFLKAAGTGSAALLSIPFAGTLARATPRTRAALAATNVAKLGCFSEPSGGETGFVDSLDAFESDIGRKVAIYRTYRGWGQPIFNDTISALLARPQPPQLYISFHAFLGSKATDPIPWAEIAAGQRNHEIDTWAAELRTITKKNHVYMCFHHEMENEEGDCGTPAEFQAAYWYFKHRIHIYNGIENLTWVVTYMRNTFYGKHGGPERWWPEASPYRDLFARHLVGVDIYNRNTCHFKDWRTFPELITHAHQFSLEKERNLFIGECGCVEGDACGGTEGADAKGDWFDEALATIKGWDNLEALCYSNIQGFNDGSYRIDTSTYSEDHFRALANSAALAG